MISKHLPLLPERASWIPFRAIRTNSSTHLSAVRFVTDHHSKWTHHRHRQHSRPTGLRMPKHHRMVSYMDKQLYPAFEIFYQQQMSTQSYLNMGPFNVVHTFDVKIELLPDYRC